MTNNADMSIGVVLLTYNARKHLPFCLPPLLNSPLAPRVLVVDSSSNDGTIEEAARMGAETLVIPRDEFNHGATREMGRKYLGTEIVVMMTQDAYPLDENMLEKLIEPVVKTRAAVSYARQIPHDGASVWESFPRSFNYPEKSQLRGIEDVDKYGIYTIFCSDSCAAYKNSVLDAIGGFGPTLSLEDTFAVAKILKNGYKIAYVAEAVVKHSHSYTLLQEFRHYFDVGYARRQNQELISSFGGAEGRGKEFFLALLMKLYRDRPSLIPYAFVSTFVKWLGYRVGLVSLNAPLFLKKAFSGQDYYWTSKFYLKRGR